MILKRQKMIHVAIAEPNKSYAKKLKRLLNSFIFSYNSKLVRYQYISKRIYAKNKTNGRFDVIFLDTDLPYCLETARMLKSLNGKIKIVFVSDGTAYDEKNIEFALEGYDIGISGYIVKTYSDQECVNALSYVLKL